MQCSPSVDVVRDLDEVIDLRALADNGRPERAAINRHVGAEFHIVANDHVADLRHLAMDAVIEHVAEAVRADDGAGVDAHAIADLGVGIERDVGEEVDVLAEQAIGADVVAALQHASAGQSAPVRPGRNTGRCGRSDQPGRSAGTMRRGMDAGGEGRLREEQRQDLGKGDAGVGHADERLAAGGAGAVNDDGRSGALLGPGEVILVLGKGEVARLGAVGGREALAGPARRRRALRLRAVWQFQQRYKA